MVLRGRRHAQVRVPPETGRGPGRDPARLQRRAGAAAKSGALLVGTPGRHSQRSPPRTYELAAGAAYRSRASSGSPAMAFRLRMAAHDAGRALVIDPGIAYSKCHSATGVGRTRRSSTQPGSPWTPRAVHTSGPRRLQRLPTTTGAFDAPGEAATHSCPSSRPTVGTRVSTFLGGSAPERGLAIAVDSEGSADVTGTPGRATSRSPERT